MSDVGLIPEELRLRADELLNEAVMGERPLVIVEGFDDIRLYEEFSKEVNLDCKIVASENILNKGEGCSGVISNINLIESVSGGVDVSKYVLGVIDRDARYFRRDMPESKLILVLKLYSIESHFVIEGVVGRILSSVLNANDDLLKKIDVEEVYRDISSKLMVLYEVSLEALKKACVKDYAAEVGYSSRVRSVFCDGSYQKIMNKKSELDDFAAQNNISKDWGGLRLICKGKWLLDFFCDHLYEYIDSLPDLCANKKLTQCQYCSNGNNLKCLYRWREKYQSYHLRGMVMGYTDLNEFDYILDRFKLLG